MRKWRISGAEDRDRSCYMQTNATETYQWWAEAWTREPSVLRYAYRVAVPYLLHHQTDKKEHSHPLQEVRERYNDKAVILELIFLACLCLGRFWEEAKYLISEPIGLVERLVRL